MHNTLIFLRHAETKKDTSIPVSDWILTKEGEIATEKMMESGLFDDVDIIVASDEAKAFLTVEPLAKKLKKTVIKVKGLVP